MGFDILTMGFNRLLAVKGVEMTYLDDVGTVYTTLLTVNPQISPELQLGQDPREQAQMTGLSPFPFGVFGGVSRPLAQGDYLNGNGAKWKLIRRDDNDADFTDSYWLQKVTMKDT